MRRIKTIFIHCTATSQKATARQILDSFKRRGWRFPGYHYIVEPDGKTVAALSEELVSNGVQGHNRESINVAYIGGIDHRGLPADNRTVEQKAALVHLLLQLRERYPEARIMGHRDIWSTTDCTKWHKSCPAFNASREYAAI